MLLTRVGTHRTIYIQSITPTLLLRATTAPDCLSWPPHNTLMAMTGLTPHNHPGHHAYDHGQYEPPTTGIPPERSLPAAMVFPHYCPTDDKARADKTRLPRPTMSAEARDSNPDLALIYTTVRETGVPNYRGASIPIPTAIRAHKWRERLLGYKEASRATTHPYPTARTTPQLCAMQYTSKLPLIKSPPWVPSWAPSRPPLHFMGPRKPPYDPPQKRH